MTRSTFTFGTHNLHDEAGIPTFFADLVIFTEAIPTTIRAKAARHAAHARARLAGYAVVACPQQRDLVIAYRRRMFKRKSQSYTRFVEGVAKVTPNRGTFSLYVEHRATGRAFVIDAEHRINAWWTNIRGEQQYRYAQWSRHTLGSLGIIQRQRTGGFDVLAGGDLNTPRGRSAYRGHLREVGTHFDRLASNLELTGVEYLSRQGSDHPRLRATVRL